MQHFFCNDTAMSHVTILAPRWTRQIAGFMPFSVQRYTVEDSYVAVGDDAVAIMSGPDFVDGHRCKCQTDASAPCPAARVSLPSVGLVFRRVFVLGRSFAVGSEDFGNVTDVLVDECTIGDDEGSSSHAFYFKMHSKYESDAFSICRAAFRLANPEGATVAAAATPRGPSAALATSSCGTPNSVGYATTPGRIPAQKATLPSRWA